ncbi:MAG: PocR ligand-binding domain-containing protein [Clostridium sp.]|nr:PocR ligand-binding domain-containing protein [Acetatifactor muris]MCM1527715.1 PocR ligand-binding domain-containing protein [Bacteroides sp.]MCM1563957.1 PocR ligand-binding domain-containing protein [Clostridium sp.]
MSIVDDLKLSDLIEVETLQKIQDAFSEMTGMASLTTDAAGNAVTVGSGFSDFCMKYTRTSELGCARCSQCDRQGAELALKTGRSTSYYCHAGLIDYAAPIMADGRLVGCFIGGQVLVKKPDLDKIRAIAEELGIDPEEYLAAAGRVNITSREKIDNAASFLSTMANVLSGMAYNNYLVWQANIELEKSGHMKSDFLANMSHEIRTPMNAVIGMAEMALREEMTPAARSYINQIKTAGKALLTIINDILDFSKIESGKMDIVEAEYEPMSIICDVANIIMTRLKGKDVELVLDVNPNLPNRMVGDSIRIKQVLLNIANNAAKFTSAGSVTVRIDYENTAPDRIELYFTVEDTGIGIKEEDLDRLFQSFQQLDSKRNRNIEGTGLGLAISKQLLTLMGGDISVESEYEKGSKFRFHLPQEITDATPCVSVKDSKSVLAAGLIANPYLKEGLYADFDKLGVEHKVLTSVKDLETLPEGRRIFIFIEHPMFLPEVEAFVWSNPQVTAILLTEFYDHVSYTVPNLLVMKKPLFSMNIAMVFNGEELHTGESEETSEFDFIAPDARILIVDDNAVNLTVAEGLLEPLKMQIDAATGGKEAIDMIAGAHYDIIFMDHMMPELDGVETTHIIRRFHPEYNDVPIIALTANAVEGTKEMFCREGMNDFVAKPIEIRMLVSKVKQWLPVEKITKVHNMPGEASGIHKKTDIKVGDLDTAFALKVLGGESLFWTVLKVYYNSIEKKAKLIKSMEEQEDWPGYTIEVHALKSASKQIGAMELSEKAAALERAGNARDSATIHRCTDEMLQQYLAYLSVLEPFCVEEVEAEEDKEEMSLNVLRECFVEMRTALDDLDMDGMEEVIRRMNHYCYMEDQKEFFARLKEAVEEIDVDTCEEILQSWEQKIL